MAWSGAKSGESKKKTFRVSGDPGHVVTVFVDSLQVAHVA